jgi:hypothetical protein
MLWVGIGLQVGLAATPDPQTASYHCISAGTKATGSDDLGPAVASVSLRTRSASGGPGCIFYCIVRRMQARVGPRCGRL